MLVSDLELTGKKVLVRSDLNVPIADGVILDSSRIIAALETFKYVIASGGILTIMSHLGRPSGIGFEKEYSLRPIADVLEQYLNKPVKLLHDFSGDNSDPSNIYLIENTRFFAGEVTACAKLSQQIAAICDVFVMDAFATSHRKHASTYAVIPYVKESCSGFLFNAEIAAIGKLFNGPKKPMVAVIGGAKISGKISVLESLLDMVDILVVAGAMANTFLQAAGHEVGRSFYEKEEIPTANNIMAKALEKGVVLYLPCDVITASNAEQQVAVTKVLAEVASEDIIYDVGPKTIAALRQIVTDANTVIWNGPLGMVEHEIYAKGSLEFARCLANSNTYSVIGGGDTLYAAQQFKDDFSYVSTGGGAFLELLANKSLAVVNLLEGNRDKG